MEIFSNGQWLPLAFAGLMWLSFLIYAVLDGYDLGVGILAARATDAERDRMIASIGPFWDANETWLVLGVGLLLVAFPVAQGMILTGLYLPVLFMLTGLIVRGVSFEFRAKAKAQYRKSWNRAFIGGSALMAFTQGYMIGTYVMGFDKSPAAIGFAVLVGMSTVAGYSLIGAAWLLMKTEGVLQIKAAAWAKTALAAKTLCIALILGGAPLVSPRIFEKIYALPHLYCFAPMGVATALLLGVAALSLRGQPRAGDRGCWKPFAATVGIFTAGFVGLASALYPFIVPGQLKIVDAGSAPQSLMIMLVGALAVLPILIGYTFLAYKVFHGKAGELRYD